MKQVENNFVLDTDAYKLTHHLQYPEGLTYLYSYGEPRYSNMPKIMFVGLQAILLKHFEGLVVTPDKIEEGKEKSLEYFGTDKYFNEEMWRHIAEKHAGRLPLRIKAVKEGTVLRPGNVCFTIESTDPKCVPLVNHSETLLMHVWYISTIATNSKLIRQNISEYLEKTGTPEIIDFMCHDFGFRGVTCAEQAGLGGFAHMINFCGSDTNIADRYIDEYYYGYPGSRLKSVLATEHSVATSFGPGEGELAYVNHILDVTPDDAICSVVSDSYDHYNFCKNVLGNEEIKLRIKEKSGRFVVRPDSGDPNIVVAKTLEILGGIFGYTINDKNYKVLGDNVGILQGDGMNRSSIDELYRTITELKWSADNLVVGSGGGLLQKNHNRDTHGWAIKASYGEIKGEGFNIQKNPATMKSKASKAGKHVLQKTGVKYTTISSSQVKNFNSYADYMHVVFENGEVRNMISFEELIANANNHKI